MCRKSMKYLVVVVSTYHFKKKMKNKEFKNILIEKLTIINLLIKV